MHAFSLVLFVPFAYTPLGYSVRLNVAYIYDPLLRYVRIVAASFPTHVSARDAALTFHVQTQVETDVYLVPVKKLVNR